MTEQGYTSLRNAIKSVMMVLPFGNKTTYQLKISFCRRILCVMQGAGMRVLIEKQQTKSVGQNYRRGQTENLQGSPQKTALQRLIRLAIKSSTKLKEVLCLWKVT